MSPILAELARLQRSLDGCEHCPRLYREALQRQIVGLVDRARTLPADADPVQRLRWMMAVRQSLLNQLTQFGRNPDQACERELAQVYRSAFGAVSQRMESLAPQSLASTSASTVRQ